MKILIIGCGSIGRRHIRLLREMGVEVCGYDENPDAMLALRDIEGVKIAAPGADLAATLRHNFDGAIVATPPHVRINPVVAAMKAGCGVMVEKPSATTADEARSILHYQQLLGRPLLVGYNLRYHPGLRRVKELLDSGAIGTVRHARIHFGAYLPDWRPGMDYRNGYAARRDTGGGVILDASHELDYACWLFGSPVAVSCVAQNTGALEIETEDVADLTVTFASGMQAVIHLDYLDREYSRWCSITGDKATANWNFATDFVWLRNGTAAAKAVDPDDMYRAELKHFLACLRGEEQPLCTGEDGLLALRLALAARESAETGKVVRL